MGPPRIRSAPARFRARGTDEINGTFNSVFEELLKVPQTRRKKPYQKQLGGLNGTRYLLYSGTALYGSPRLTCTPDRNALRHRGLIGRRFKSRATSSTFRSTRRIRGRRSTASARRPRPSIRPSATPRCAGPSTCSSIAGQPRKRSRTRASVRTPGTSMPAATGTSPSRRDRCP